MSNIAAAFVKAQRGFAPALKDKTNPHFKSKYADLSSCVDSVIDSLNANGIALIQKTIRDEAGVTVETVFLHESGETIECGLLHVPAAKNDPQGYGSALTYARRYSLMAACGIAPEDDDGNAASRAQRMVVTYADDKDSLVPVLEASIAAARETKLGARAAAGKEAADRLDENTRTALRKLSAKVEACASVPDAFDLIKEQGLTDDERAYLWDHLSSKIRSALKQEGQVRALKQHQPETV